VCYEYAKPLPTAETQVAVYGPGSGPCTWNQLVDLTAKLREHLEATAWRAADTRVLGAPSAGNNSLGPGFSVALNPPDRVLRLRGGAKTPSKRSTSTRSSGKGKSERNILYRRQQS
jgi:hypothetical protein